MGVPGKIPGTFGADDWGRDPAPAVPFGSPANQIGTATPGVAGRIPGTNGENMGDQSPAVPFGSSVFSDDPLPGTFGDGVCMPEWSKR